MNTISLSGQRRRAKCPYCFWLQAQQLEGAGLQGSGLGELLEAWGPGLNLNPASVAAARGEFSQRGFEAVEGKPVTVTDPAGNPCGIVGRPLFVGGTALTWESGNAMLFMSEVRL